MEAEATSVLVAGGGLVGLSAAIFLASRGVPTVLVERRADSSPHPRAIGYTPRTMELFRAVGLGGRIPQAPRDISLRRVRAESLAGAWFEEQAPWTPEDPKTPRMEYSPCAGAAIAQDRLEPILRERAMELGADIRFETELVGMDQDSGGVVASARRGNASPYRIRADYLVAADGHRSPVREALGIGLTGRGHIRTTRSVLFRAPLEAYLKKGVMQFSIDQPGFEAFLTTYGDGRWVLMFSDDAERDEAALTSMVVKAIGRSDLPIEILAAGRWELSALIADQFASGRVFLAGDAAHTLPPNRGGYGANTGIEDVHNLAWKLAAVVSGQSRPALLDTYDAERRPIAWLRHQQIFARADYRAHAAADAGPSPIIDDDAMEFGQLYRSMAVFGAGDALPAALRPDQWAGQPGTRAPHLWMIRDGTRLSTLDLFQNSWVLLAEDERWRTAAARAGEALGIRLDCPCLGAGLRPADPDAFRRSLGIGAGGAVLVRPDGYIAWRTVKTPADPVDALSEAVARVSFAHPKGASAAPGA